MKDLTLYCWGGCEVFDCLQTLKNNFNTYKDKFRVPRNINYNVDFHPPRISTSLLSLYSKFGDIGLRMHESLKPVETKLSISEQILAQEILKYPFLEFFRKKVETNDVLLLSFTAEALTKLVVKDEVITISPPVVSKNDHPNRSKFQWLFDDYLLKDQYLMSFDERKNLNDTTDVMENFIKDIFGIFNNRVILIKSYPAKFIMLENLTLAETKPNCFQIPYYSNKKIATNPLDHNYVQRNLSNAERIFLRYYPTEIPVVDIGEENYFMDHTHRWGLHPYHYHQTTVNKITLEIEKAIATL
jgi:hypothetical protein